MNSVKLRLVVVEDEPPRVVIVDPEPMAFAVEDWTVPVEVQAIDDIQLRELQLRYQRSGETPATLMLKTQQPDRRQLQGKGEINLAQLAARAGDEIRLVASARDNDPQEPQVRESTEHLIRVISHDEYLDYLRAVYQMEQLSAEIAQLNERLNDIAQQRRQLLDDAQDLTSQLEAGDSADETQQQDVQQLRESLVEYTRQLQELSQQVRQRLETPQLYDVERAYREQLQQLADQLEQQQGDSAKLREPLESIASEPTLQKDDLESLREGLRRLEQKTEPLGDRTRDALTTSEQQAEQLARAQEMMAEADRLDQVRRQQRDLAERLQTSQDPPPTESSQPPPSDQLRASKNGSINNCRKPRGRYVSRHDGQPTIYRGRRRTPADFAMRLINNAFPPISNRRHEHSVRACPVRRLIRRCKQPTSSMRWTIMGYGDKASDKRLVREPGTASCTYPLTKFNKPCSNWPMVGPLHRGTARIAIHGTDRLARCPPSVYTARARREMCLRAVEVNLPTRNVAQPPMLTPPMNGWLPNRSRRRRGRPISARPATYGACP